MVEQTLLLNATYEPLQVVPWQRAMTLWAQNKVEIVSEHDREARSVSFTFRLPSVVRLLRFVKTRLRHQGVPFTRANIYRRDEHACQYCGESFETEELTFDHVIPESRGGPKCFENIVTACLPCNRKKDDRTPEEAGMPLRRQPRRPPSSPVFRVSLTMRKTPGQWRSFLYMTTGN